uniref:fermitin family homolog 3-like n=1 Tax=Agelaius phoeniceus TaxID=39638 RepID=UPI0023EB91A0|nr:fermitin family homolog 3-like [Agelaius phoeniceus]
MAGLKMATGEEIDGSFELRVEVEEEREAPPDPGTRSPPFRPGSGRALWWEQRRRWLLSPSPTLDALGVGGGSRLRFAPRLRPLRLRLPPGGVLRTRLDCAETPGRAVAALCALLGLPHPEELSLLWPERVGEGRDPPPPPPRPGPDPPETRLRPSPRVAPPPVQSQDWGGGAPQDPPGAPPGPPGATGAAARAGVAAEQELELCFKYPCAMGEPQPGLHSQLLQAQALGSILAEEIECSEEQGLRFAALQVPPKPPQNTPKNQPKNSPKPAQKQSQKISK